MRKTDLKSQSRSTYLVPRLHRLLVIAESTDGLLGNLFEPEDLGATAGARRPRPREIVRSYHEAGGWSK
jgi:hypothetical protein